MKKVILSLCIAAVAMVTVNAQNGGNATGTLTSKTTTSPDPQVTPNASQITFKSTVYDFGTVEVGSDGNCNFIFTNTGTDPLTISLVKPGCGCTVPKWPRKPIAPGASDTVKVNYTKMKIPPHDFKKTCTVFSTSKGGSVVLTIKGFTKDSTGKMQFIDMGENK